MRRRQPKAVHTTAALRSEYGAHSRWLRDYPGDWPLYLHDLLPAPLHIGGGHHGGYPARLIESGFTGHIDIWEPVSTFHALLTERFAGNPMVTVHHAGLGDANATTTVYVDGDRSSIEYQPSGWGGEAETVRMQDVADLTIGTLWMNCEGAEYRIAGRLVDTGRIDEVQTLIYQPHEMQDSLRLLYQLRAGLANSHVPLATYDWAWDIWVRD